MRDNQTNTVGPTKTSGIVMGTFSVKMRIQNYIAACTNQLTLTVNVGYLTVESLLFIFTANH